MKIEGLYAIVWTESGELLSPDSFKKYWPNYGSNGVPGWRPPKKVYFSLGAAKAGFSHIPVEIKPLVSIAQFSNPVILLSGDELALQQAEAKVIREAKQAEKRQVYEKARLERQLSKLNDDISATRNNLSRLGL